MLFQDNDVAVHLSAEMYSKGYAFWHSHVDLSLPPQDYTAYARLQCKLWSDYLQSASGLHELLVADVQPGLWNNRWELLLPLMQWKRHIKPWPIYPLSNGCIAAEIALHISPLRSRIAGTLQKTSSVFGLDALVACEELDQASHSSDVHAHQVDQCAPT